LSNGVTRMPEIPGRAARKPDLTDGMRQASLSLGRVVGGRS
jgi:hypothetical protein